MIHSRSIAWLALLATLFSAASPTFAAAIFAHEPAALRQMLGLPSTPVVPAAAEHSPEHADHTPAYANDGSSGDHDGPEHATHGIYCSFCLNAGSVATLAAAPGSLCLLRLTFDIAAPAKRSPHFPVVIPQYRSRAPPFA